MTNKIVLHIMVSVGVLIINAGCGKEKSEVEQQSQGADSSAFVTIAQSSINEIGLKTEVITRKPFSAFLTIPAKVLADQDNEATVGTLVQGRVCKVLVKAGDYVKAGQELMLLEGLEIGEIKAAFLSAKANLAYQKSNYERQKKLLDENIGAQKNLLESLNEYEKASAEYNAEKNKIYAIGLTESEVINGKGNVSEYESSALAIKAPISGLIVERTVVVGQLIETTTTAFKIINLSSVWIDGQVYEKDIGKINSNAVADFLVPSYPDETFRGKITYVGQILDEKTRTITIRAELKNPSGKLKPQMFGEMRILSGNNTTALLVPQEALVKIDNADYLFVQKQNTSFKKTPVTFRPTQNELVEIISGIEESDKVVVKGAFYLKSEMMKSSLGGE